MSTELERRYRRALGWYPRGWREKNADVVAGTLLDVADAEHRTRPRRGELANLAASGISTRLGVLLEPRARNAISTIALATGAGYTLVFFALEFWSMAASVRNTIAIGQSAAVWPILNSGLIVVAVWAAALTVGLTRQQRGLKSMMFIAIFASIVLSLINRIPSDIGQWYGLTTTSLVFLALLGALTLLGTPRHGARLVLYSGVALACVAGVHLITRYAFHAEISESRFWINVLRVLVPALGTAALAAVVNGVVGRKTIAQIIVISMVPWLGAYLIVCIAADEWNSIAQIGIVTVLVSFGVGLSALFRRTSADRRQDLTGL